MFATARRRGGSRGNEQLDVKRGAPEILCEIKNFFCHKLCLDEISLIWQSNMISETYNDRVEIC